MPRSMVALILLSVSLGLHAQSIYKCVGHKGDISYQSEPCASGVRAAGVHNFERLRDDPVATQRAADIRQEMDRRSQAMHSGAVTYSTSSNNWSQRDQQKQNCASARQYREQAIQAAGLGRNYDLLQSLDESVNRACAGL
jgi:hypothetical protein